MIMVWEDMLILMDIILTLTILMLLAIFLSVNISSPDEIARATMKESILKIERILRLTDYHYEVELDRMSDEDLTELYQDLGERFDTYIRERNAQNNEQALEEF